MTTAIDGNFFSSLIALKNGNKEFALGYAGGEWFAAIGNKSDHVNICEALAYSPTAADFVADGASAEEVLVKLLDLVLVAQNGGAA